ncbi:unnamed protein product [Rotaria sp. Silwood2]|nr:unnamed protein product [Rotaria sp. Silwood2]
MILEMIESLFLRRRSYTSSDAARVGLVYNNQKRTVIKYNTKDGEVLGNLSNLDSFYYECESIFRRRYDTLLSSWYLSTKEKDQLKSQQTGCGYVDFRSEIGLSIACDEIPCDRLATVICQKSPIQKTRATYM